MVVTHNCRSTRDRSSEGKPNARVLAYLLRPENSSYMVAHKSDERWITRAFLRLVAIQQPKIQALLDVGSQILDLSNVQVAKAWLEIARDAAGAIYFDDADELMVLTRNGFISPLSSSALCQQLSRCVVYLDHAHTRDTDIKFPVGSRAAVTLGPKMTKDALVQGPCDAEIQLPSLMVRGFQVACGCANWDMVTPSCFLRCQRLTGASARHPARQIQTSQSRPSTSYAGQYIKPGATSNSELLTRPNKARVTNRDPTLGTVSVATLAVAQSSS